MSEFMKLFLLQLIPFVIITTLSLVGFLGTEYLFAFSIATIIGIPMMVYTTHTYITEPNQKAKE